MTYETDNPLFSPKNKPLNEIKRAGNQQEGADSAHSCILSESDRKMTAPTQDITPKAQAWLNGLCRIAPCRMYGEPLPAKERDAGQLCPLLGDCMRRCFDGESHWPLFIWGEPGSGKTCAGLLACDEYGGLYVTLEDACDRIRLIKKGELTWRNNHGRGGVLTEKDGWTDWHTPPFAVIDEIGERESSDFRTATFKKILDIREQLPTILISNLDLDGIQEMYDRRIRSRMGAGTIIETSGDRRERT